MKPSASRTVAGQNKHRSIGTEEAYTNWFKRYIYFHDSRHPAELGAPEVQAFLNRLVMVGNVAASTQNPCTERSEATPSARLCWPKNPSAGMAASWPEILLWLFGSDQLFVKQMRISARTPQQPVSWLTGRLQFGRTTSQRDEHYLENGRISPVG